MDNHPYSVAAHAADLIRTMFDSPRFIPGCGGSLDRYVVSENHPSRLAHLIISSLKWSLNEAYLLDVVHLFVVLRGGVFPVEWRDAIGWNKDEADDEIMRYHAEGNAWALNSMRDAALQIVHESYGVALPDGLKSRSDVVEQLLDALRDRDAIRARIVPSEPRWNELCKMYLEWWDRQTGVMNNLLDRL